MKGLEIVAERQGKGQVLCYFKLLSETIRGRDQGLYDMNWDLQDSSLSNKHPISHEYSFHPSQILNL